ncbi:oligosaccharide repeat unit polymerase [Vibrio cholerae]|nr:oligosaccharide repeat unit polymerase [Vibrio cholerae]EKF9882206.1 oligosaccharide repeat unit polymerase [Vibrio cholerae]
MELVSLINTFDIFLRIIIIIIIVITVTNSFLRNKDIFSPIKLYSVFNVFFYLDVFINKYDILVVISYTIICLTILILSFFESENVHFKMNKSIKFHISKRIVISIWFFSIISIINQLIIIIELGGLVNYIGNIAYRVEYFKGKGYVIILNNLIATMNVIYFSMMLVSSNLSKKSWVIFFIHFFIFVFIALLSGSRSFLLMTILVEIIIYHYLKKEFTLVKLLPYVVFIGVMIAVLGGVRNTVSTTDGELKLSSTDDIKLESTHFKYGLIPLEIVFSSDDKPLLYGSTYASLITNFIPRIIYPEKLDSGGVAFTKIYTGDKWGGLSNLATGSITEGIINFGLSVGLVVGVLILSIALFTGLILYSKLPIFVLSNTGFIKIILYVYFLLAASRLSYSEFSYTYYTYILYYFIPAIGVIVLSKLISIRLNH